jgi:hypothetical protein
VIRAVIPTESRTHAPVVYLNIQSFIVVISRIYRTDRFTWGIVTVLAEHRKEPSLYIGICSLPIAFNSDPFDSPAFKESGLLIDRYIIFGLTRNHACLACCTAIKIDYHTPFVIRPLFCFCRYHQLILFLMMFVTITACMMVSMNKYQFLMWQLTRRFNSLKFWKITFAVCP